MSTTLSQTKNRAFGYFKFRTKRNITTWILLMFLNLMGMPFMYFMSAMLYIPGGKTDGSIPYNDFFNATPIISVFSIGLAVLVGFLSVYIVFDYLHNKTMGDMIYSTPITKNKRFTADYLSGLFIYITPFMFGAVLGEIMCAISTAIIPAEDRILPDCKTLGIIIFGLILAMIMAYALAVFVLMCCGSILESVVYSITSIFIIPALIFSTVCCGFSNLYGINSDAILWKIICPTSPFGILAGTVFTVQSEYEVGSGAVNYNMNTVNYENYIFRAKFLIPVIIIILALVVGAFFLNRKRKAEKCGTPFVFKGLYYFMVTSMVICAYFCSVGSTEGNSVIIAVSIIIGIVYLLLEVVTNRGFKKLWRGVIRYIITSLLSLFCAIGLVKANGFGICQKIPEIEDVKSVYINEYLNEEYYFSVTEPEYIQTIIEAHQKAVDSYDFEKETFDIESNYNYGKYDGTEFNITYCMKNGTTISRNYYDIPFESKLLLKKIEVSEGYKQAKYNAIKNNFSKSTSFYISDSSESREYSFEISQKIDKTKFLDNLEKDIMAVSEDEVLNGDFYKVCELRNSGFYGGIYNLDIFSNYKNTINYLKECGVMDYLDNNLSNKETEYTAYILSPDISYSYKDDDGNQVTKNDLEISYSSEKNFDVDTCSYVYEIGSDDYTTEYLYNYDLSKIKICDTSSDEFKELFKYAKSNFISGEKCYSIVLDYGTYIDDSMIIPASCSELAEKVFNSGEEFTQEYLENMVEKKR